MKLITGMPRSGTTFIQRIFHAYGARMSPPHFSRAGYKPKDEFNLSEPSILAKLCNRGAGVAEFKEAILRLSEHYNRTEVVVTKLPQLCFFPRVCDAFDEVILCRAPVNERYLKSGTSHNIAGWLQTNPSFLKPLKERTLKGMSEYWLKQTHEIEDRDNVKLYNFGSREDFDKIFEPLLGSLLDEAYTKHWRGSRFEEP